MTDWEGKLGIQRVALEALKDLGEATEEELARLEGINKLLVPEVFYHACK